MPLLQTKIAPMKIQDAALAILFSIAIHIAALGLPIFPESATRSPLADEKPQALHLTFAAPQASPSAQKKDAARAVALRAREASLERDSQDSRAFMGAGTAPKRTEGESLAAAPQNARPNYLARLKAHLLPHRRYPEQARIWRLQGTAHIRFSLNGNGDIQKRQIHQTSGHVLLDKEALALLRRAEPMPPPPLKTGETLFHITLPILFALR